MVRELNNKLNRTSYYEPRIWLQNHGLFYRKPISTKKMLGLKFNKIKLEKEIYDSDDFPKFVEDNGIIYDIRNENFTELYNKKLQMMLENNEFFQAINEIVHPSTFGGISQFYIINHSIYNIKNCKLLKYDDYCNLKKEILNNEKERLKKIINKRLHDEIFNLNISNSPWKMLWWR